MAESVYDSPESQMTDHRPQLSLTYNTISRWCFTRINVVNYVPIFPFLPGSLRKSRSVRINDHSQNDDAARDHLSYKITDPHED
jgi:hypothetical protein